ILVAFRKIKMNVAILHLLMNIFLLTQLFLHYCLFINIFTSCYFLILSLFVQLGLCVSRASAAVLNLNCSLVFLPMCRTLLAFIRGSQKVMGVELVTSRKARRLLDKSKTFHGICGVTICVFSGKQLLSHLETLMYMCCSGREGFLWPNRGHKIDTEDPRRIIFTTVPGVTGFLMVLILFLMCTASTHSMRVSNYDVFWYTHNLFIVFYTLLLLHVAGFFFKFGGTEPPNKKKKRKCEHFNGPYPKYFYNCIFSLLCGGRTVSEKVTYDKIKYICPKLPFFLRSFLSTWLWVSGPLCLYCAERLYRYMRSNRPVTIVSVISHPCDVIEIRMVKENFKAKPGQYIILHCPSVSTFENHPFTLTRCPTETRATFGVHLKVLGDWTDRFRDLLVSQSTEDTEILPIIHQRHYPKLYIDGPFGSPSEEVFSYEVSLCVAGGIGVTPFASVFNALLDNWKGYRLCRLYFIWVCRDIQAFYWFADLLCALHNKLWQENLPDYLNIQLYLSQVDGIQSIIGEKYQALNSRLLIGRPRWKLLFEEIAKCN
uniref:NADPH oxidase 4 n=1 Tax=Latimeria chalumnae TaxID=7897 RepID=H3AQA5_LATCH